MLNKLTIKVSIVLGIVLLVVIVMTLVKNSTNNSNSTQANLVQSTEVAPLANETVDHSDTIVSTKPQSIWNSEVVDWQQNHFGYLATMVIPSDYDNYSIDTLTSLGEQGDLKALDLLAWKYLKLNDTENQIKVYRKAALFGSTYALKRLGKLESKLYRKYDNSEVRRKQMAHIELAYYQAALLRGDTDFLFMAKSYLTSRKIVIDDLSKETVQKKGLEIYQELKSERIKMGLPEFETMPLKIKKYYDFIANRHPSLITGESPFFIIE